MEKGDLDTYIATFNKLAGLAGYSPSDQGALALFKKGLPMPLNLSIVQHTNPRLDTLVDWQKAAREQQLKYLQTREFRKPLSSKQKAFANCLGVNNQGQRDLNVMDMDATQPFTHFTKLTEEEKVQLRKQGACFRCQQDGHMSRECPKKNGSAEYGRPAPTNVSGRSAAPEEPTKETIEDTVNKMGMLSATLEAKQKYFDLVIEKGFV
jgi:hypothetical protein